MKRYFWTENKQLEHRVKCFFDTIEEYNQREFEGGISMLLLGSMSRGEASWKNIDGIDTIVSDIEVMTLLPQDFTKIDRLYEVFEESKKKCFVDQNSSLFHIDYCVCKNNYDLSRMEKKLLTYDAYVFAYTVVGNDYKQTLPKVTYFNINMQDIWEVLVHRIFSVLYWGRPLKKEGKEEEYRYNLAKNSLDLMIVLLVNHGRLVSGFANRLEAIRKLDVSQDIKNYFEFCLSVKFSSDCSYSYSVDEMENMFINLIEQLNNNFKCHVENYLRNLKSISKRRAGQIKRMIISKHLPSSQKEHLKMLIQLFKAKKELSKENLLDNYVLNGYPNYEIISL